ncbi:MAG: Cytochrome b6-f complex iron-sulfur subunit [Phycisphaerae bacterium]|nr:Cytochrome b6-f complex iron-sulfur subunit [Phycisphaerae bacterium]
MSETTHDPAPTHDRDGRRTFCKLCIGGLSVASAATVAYPVASFLGMPITVGANKPVAVPLSSLAPGQAHYAEFQGQQIVILSDEEGQRVFSASCPHLGCNVMWSPADALFHCPCHGAVFNSHGQVVSGPVSASLKKVPFEVKNGVIIVS